MYTEMAIHVKTAVLIADRISVCISRTILIRELSSYVQSPEYKRKKNIFKNFARYEIFITVRIWWS